MLFLTHNQLLVRVSDWLNQDLTTSGKSFYEKRAGRSIRIAQDVCKDIGADNTVRREEYKFVGDGSSAFYEFVAPYREVEDVLMNDYPLERVDYQLHLRNTVGTIFPALSFGTYFYINENGLGFGAALETSDTIKLLTKAFLPRLRETPTTITEADWTNDSFTVDTIVGATLSEGSNVDKCDSILGPDGRVYRIATIPSSSSVTLTERYKGTTVTGTSGATTIGGHLAVDERWHSTIVFKTAYRLLLLDEEYDAAAAIKAEFLSDQNIAADSQKSLSGVMFTR